MRRKKRKERKKRFFSIRFVVRFFLIILFFAVIAGAGYQVYTAPFFKVSSENIQVNFQIDKRIKEEVAGKNIFSVDLSHIYSEIIRFHPEYKEVTLIKRFPDAIEIHAKKRQPVAQVHSEGFYLIDREGVVISQSSLRQFKEYPLISGVAGKGRLVKGKKINGRDLRAAFDIISSLKQKDLLEKINLAGEGYNFRLSSINILPIQTVYFYLEDFESDRGNIKIIMEQENMQEKFALLEQLLTEKLRDRISLVSHIDFRFKNVVVGFQR